MIAAATVFVMVVSIRRLLKKEDIYLDMSKSTQF